MMIWFSSVLKRINFFSKESDIALIIVTHKLGYGNWKHIKKHLRTHTRCRFDHALLSRTENEIKKRVDMLIKAVEKEAKDQLAQIKSIEVKEILNMKLIWEETQKIVPQEDNIETDSDPELKNEILMIREEMKEREKNQKEAKKLESKDDKGISKEHEESSDNESTLSKSEISQSSEISRPKSPKKSTLLSKSSNKRKRNDLEDSDSQNARSQKRKKVH